MENVQPRQTFQANRAPNAPLAAWAACPNCPKAASKAVGTIAPRSAVSSGSVCGMRAAGSHIVLKVPMRHFPPIFVRYANTLLKRMLFGSDWPAHTPDR